MSAELRRLIANSWNDEQSDLEWGHLRGQRAEFGVKVRAVLPGLLDVVDAARDVIAAQYGIHLGVVGGPPPSEADFTPMVTSESMAALRAALERLDR